MKRHYTYLILAISCVPIALIASGHVMKSKVPFEPLIIEDLERFHGHVGPFVALGGRIGEHAVVEHKIPRYFGLTVDVECKSGPPYTCIIDGLQMSTGATMGKANIIHHPAESGFKVIITDNESGKQLTYTFKPEITALMKKWDEEGKLSIEDRGEKLFAMKAEELFDVVVGKK